MQKQNHFKLSATDPTPSSQDQSDPQSSHGDVTNDAYLSHIPRDPDDIGNLFVHRNFNDDNHHTLSSIGNNSVIFNEHSESHRLVPSHQSDFQDSPRFVNPEEESLFSFQDVMNKNHELDTKDIDDDKYFQPIPPSPFEYVEESNDYNDNDNYNNGINSNYIELHSTITKPRLDDDDLDSSPLDIESYLDMHYNSFGPLDSSFGSEMFEGIGMTRNDAREVDNSFHRPESCALSEHDSNNNNNNNNDKNNSNDNNNQLGLEDDSFDFGLVSSVNDLFNSDNVNGGFCQNSGFSTTHSRQSQKATRHSFQELGHCSSLDFEFGDNLDCPLSGYNNNRDDPGRHYIAASRKRTVSGGNDFTDINSNNNNNNSNNNNNNINNNNNNNNKKNNNLYGYPNELQHIQKSFKNSPRKRMASGDVASNSRQKIPRRCTSLGNERMSTFNPFPHDLQSYIVNRGASDGTTDRLFEMLYSTIGNGINTNGTLSHPTQTNQTGNEIFPTNSLGQDNDGFGPQTKADQYPGMLNSLSSQSPGNDIFRPPSIGPTPRSSTHTRPNSTNIGSSRHHQIDVPLVNMSSPNINNITNRALNQRLIETNVYDLDIHQSQLLPGVNGDITGSSNIHSNPSRQSSFFTTSPQRAANQSHNSHPFTVRSSSTTSSYNETPSTSDFYHAYSNSSRASIPETSPVTQEKHGHQDRFSQNVNNAESEEIHIPRQLSMDNIENCKTFMQSIHQSRHNSDSNLQTLLSIVSDSIPSANSPNGNIASNNAQAFDSQPTGTIHWDGNAITANGRSITTNTNDTNSYKTTLNSASQYSPATGNTFTVPDMLQNNDTIGFLTDLTGSNNPTSRKPPVIRRADLVPDTQGTISSTLGEPTNTFVSNPSTNLSTILPMPTGTHPLSPNHVTLNTQHTTGEYITAGSVAETTRQSTIPTSNSTFTTISNSVQPLPIINNTTTNTRSSFNSSKSIKKEISQSIPESNSDVVPQEPKQSPNTFTNQVKDCVPCQPSTDDPALEKALNECLRTGSQTSLIKEELKRKILYKRCVQGIQDIPPEPDTPSPQNQLTEEEEIKRKRRLESNRVAAARMRTRKKEEQEESNKECQQLEERQTLLKMEIMKLEDEKMKMLLLLSHYGIGIDTSSLPGC